MEIVINEWFLDYMVPGSRDAAFPGRFLDFIQAKSFRIVIKVPSPFTEKFYRFCRLNRRVNPKFGKRLTLEMLNADKVVIVHQLEISPLPDEIQSLFLENKIKEDDRYLVELVYTIPGSVVITTDNPLVEVLRPFLNERIQTLNEFCGMHGLASPTGP